VTSMVHATTPGSSSGQVNPEARSDANDEARSAEISQWGLIWRRFSRNRLSVWALRTLVLMYGLAVFAPFLAPYGADRIDTNHSYAEPTRIVFLDGQLAVCALEQSLDPFLLKSRYVDDCSRARPIEFLPKGDPYWLFGLFKLEVHLFGITPGEALKGGAVPVTPVATPTAAPADPLASFRVQQPDSVAPKLDTIKNPPKIYLLGADQQGRDVLSRMLVGSQVSLTVGLVGVFLSLTIGSVMGATSGYVGGTWDNVIQRTIEIIRSVPTLPLWAAIAAALPRTTTIVQRYFLITLVLSLVGWTGLARELRGKVMAYRSLDYIAAARLAGSSDLRIILAHMLPNAASHIIVVATLAVPYSILGETTLSFLGLGMLPPAVSWGVLLKDAQQLDSVLIHPWMLIPALPVVLTVACYFLLGDGLRDAVDPYSS
jgi:peptide/nickel transport system permease protein